MFVKGGNIMTVFDVVENSYWKLIPPSKSWPTAKQDERLYERAILKIMLKRLDDNDNMSTLHSLYGGLLTVDDKNPNAPGVRTCLNVLKDFIFEEDENV